MIMSKPFQIEQIRKKAYTSWMGQKQRCENPKCPSYKYYGEKGVKRIWTLKECFEFYLTEIEKRPLWKDPVISRKNDIGNYELGNCILLERSENGKQVKTTEKKRINSSLVGRKNVHHAYNANKKKVVIIPICEGKIKRFNSAKEASENLGFYKRHIDRCISLKVKIKIDGNFYYAYWE